MKLWQSARALVKKVLCRLGLYPLASSTLRQLRNMKHRPAAAPIAPPAAPQEDESAWELEDARPHGYEVICLPVIPWDSRFQRPQQLMAQLARRNHRVFYASLDFHDGTAAELAPLGPNVFEMRVPGTPGTSVYRELPSAAHVERMALAIDRLRVQKRITSAVIVVQLPFWNALAEDLRERFGWPIVYDCMDDHSGFSTNCEAMLQAEDRTVAAADLVVVTSEVLRDKVQSKAHRTALIRNACDYEHFAVPAVGSHQNDPGRFGPHPSPLPEGEGIKTTVTIGFYGAIAEWFDSNLVADLAELRSAWRFELIGSTYTGDVTRLEKLPNVELLGEQPYAELPRRAADWNCFIIPFKRIPLTEATNPVKAYEMLATGKPVVAVDLPELRPLGRDGLLALANNAAEFAAAIEKALADNCPTQRVRRQAFAAENTWSDRCDSLEQAVRELFPPASIIIATWNNLDLTKACLDSIFERTDYPNYEVIVVDNASTDGTPQWLVEASAREPRLRVICNATNRGFAGGNNQGLRIARGEYLCLLNNDTQVTHGWLSTLVGHLRKMPAVGLIGPVSNNVGNEAKVGVAYRQPEEMPRWAQWYCRRHDGEVEAIGKLGFFCVLMPRAVYRQVGELDEQFGLGYFEDDDYCHRVRREGYEMCFVRDAFVHHWQEASFGLLGREAYLRTFYKNQELFRAKWGADNPVGAT